ARLGAPGIMGLALLSSVPAIAQSNKPLVIEPAAEKRVQLLWPSTTNFNVLQETLGFDGTNLWQDVPDAPTVIGTGYGLLREATNDAAFYRLVNRGIAGSSTPPDPASTATPPAPNVFNDLASLT